MSKLARAIASARAATKGADYTGATPLPAELAQHPATTSAPTETYPNPDDMGGWRHVIEDAAQMWIAFVDVGGKALLWTKRDPEGGVVGVPYSFQRGDLGAVAGRFKGGNLALTLTASAALPTGPRKAPDRVRIWRAGANPGDYGACNLTPKAAAMVLAAYEARGNLAPIDIEHGTNHLANPNYDPNKPPPGGGYYAVKVVETRVGPEIWADPVRWSDYARNEIESGSRGYISPDWDMTTDTREPVRLNKISLVLEPGTYSVNLLASASASRGSKTMNEIEQLRAAYAALLSMINSTDPGVKKNATELCAALKEQASTLGIDLDAAPETVAADPVVAEALPAPPAAAPAAAARAASLPAAKDEAPAVARAVAARGLTLTDVQTEIRSENAKRDLLGLALTNREGMTPTLVSVLASKSLAEVRSIVGAMPLKTVAATAAASTGTPPGKVPPAQLGATASAAAVEGAGGAVETDKPTPEEAADIERMRRSFGLSIESVTASRKALEAGEGGVLSVARLTALRTAGRAETAAKVAAAK